MKAIYTWGGLKVRESKSRFNYTYAVVRGTHTGNGLVVWGCASSYKLAEKALAAARRVNNDYIIVELTKTVWLGNEKMC